MIAAGRCFAANRVVKYGFSHLFYRSPDWQAEKTRRLIPLRTAMRGRSAFGGGFQLCGFGDELPVSNACSSSAPQHSLSRDRRLAVARVDLVTVHNKANIAFISQYADRALTSLYFLVSLTSLFAVRFTLLSPDIRLCWIFAAGVIINSRSRSSGRALKMVLWNSPSQLAGASRV